MNEMNHKPFLQRLNKQKTRTVPFWFMRQAGRYLPEYRKLRADKGGFLDMVYDPDAACEITMQPIRRFEMDAAILFSDILVIPQALGQHLEFVPGIGPKLNPVRQASEINALSFDDHGDVLDPIYQTLSNVRSALAQERYNSTALIGFAGSPWTVACYMVEGQGSKDFKDAKVLAYQNPEMFQILIDKIVQATIQYLVKQVEAGAETLQLFESWGGALDYNQFEKWSIEPTRAIIEGVRAVHPDIPIIGFPKGAGHNLELYAAKTGITAVALDSSVSPGFAARAIEPQMPVQGNLDPFCLFAGGKALEEETDKILHALGAGDFIFNLGHGIHKDTPIAHVERLVKKIKNFACG